MKFTIEALYALHIFNDYSNDLVFLPTPFKEGEGKKEGLLRILEAGYEDLKKMGLVLDNKPTEKCAEYGLYLKEYHDAEYHCQIDLNYFYAPQVDEFNNMAVIIHQDDEGLYHINRTGDLVFLAFLMQHHPVLQNADDKIKDYLHSQWEEEAYLRFMVHHGNDEGIHITVANFGKITQDILYVTNSEHLYKYDLEHQLLCSIDSEQLKKEILGKLKVKVYNGG